MHDEAVRRRYADAVSDDRSGLDARLQSEPWDDFGAFGWLRGVRERALMLELRRKTGTVLAVGYGWLERAEFDPSEGITLYIVGQRVSIRGCNLNSEVRPLVRLFEGITRQRVPWIREASQVDRLAAPEGACIVESIQW
jgi:hypothetical protein